ncbi:MAG: hypothetical protein Aurels2KO_42610 [Aureliella sp.]
MVVSANLGISPKAALKLIHDCAVRCDGRMVTAGHQKLNVGSFVEVEQLEPVKEKPPVAPLLSSKRFEIVHEDDDIVVVNKPAGLLTVPTDSRRSGSLKQQIEKHYGQTSHESSSPKAARRGRRGRDVAELTCVHRLDRSVSGLLVFARNKEAAQRLREQFQDHSASRKYVAIVAGTISDDTGSFDANLDTAGGVHVRRASGDDGQTAVTHFDVHERLRGATVVNVRLETGRRNQIRVHFADAGHPVLGDPRYSASRAAHPGWQYQRVALHACSLSFRHPSGREVLSFDQSWPREFGAFVKSHRKS